MSILTTLLLIFAGCSIAMTISWMYAMKIKNIGVVDVAWAGLMAAAGIFCAIIGNGSSTAKLATGLFAGLWGTRLFHSLFKRVFSEPEDGRYQALRQTWNGSPTKLFVFFQGQAVIVTLFSLPFIAASSNTTLDAGLWLVLAVLVFILSVSGETIADRQLATFRGNAANRGKTCRQGLWAWSRHPNYFFEWLHWFSYVLLAVGGGYFMFSLIGPVVMLLFLYRVSGIPWTEAQAIRSRGDDYLNYQKQVSAFFPRPPKKNKGHL